MKRQHTAADCLPEHAILAAVRRIPRGRVSTYGEIAALAGWPRRARLVGTVLKHTAVKVPWHRVVNAAGRISFPIGSDNYRHQLELLQAEGVAMVRGRVDLKRHRWPERDRGLDQLLWSIEQRTPATRTSRR